MEHLLGARSCSLPCAPCIASAELEQSLDAGAALLRKVAPMRAEMLASFPPCVGVLGHCGLQMTDTERIAVSGGDVSGRRWNDVRGGSSA